MLDIQCKASYTKYVKLTIQTINLTGELFHGESY